MLTTKQAAEKLKSLNIKPFSPDQVKRLCRDYEQGKPGIKAEKIGTSWGIQEKDLDTYIKRKTRAKK